MRYLLLFMLLSLAPALMRGQQRYIFYLHGKIVEDQGPNAVDTIRGFGAYKYEDILDVFKKEKFTVISEVRAPNTDIRLYAEKVSRQVDSLMRRGVKPDHITVVGASKGAIIAMLVSSIVKDKDLNFVFLAGCNASAGAQFPELQFCGNILSVYEESDEIANSCRGIRSLSQEVISHYKEIMLHTGLRHGFLYRPLKEWVKPALAWAGGHYE